jgi:hypothetical protein
MRQVKAVIIPFMKDLHIKIAGAMLVGTAGGPPKRNGLVCNYGNHILVLRKKMATHNYSLFHIKLLKQVIIPVVRCGGYLYLGPWKQKAGWSIGKLVGNP